MHESCVGHVLTHKQSDLIFAVVMILASGGANQNSVITLCKCTIDLI